MSMGFAVVAPGPGRLIAGLLALMLAPSASAQVVFNVNSTADLIDVDTDDGECRTLQNNCTLRAAVMQANKVSGPGATIMLSAGTYTLARPVAGINGDDSGDLNLTAPPVGSTTIAIVGAGADSTVIDANQIDRVLRVAAGRTASISGVTVRKGFRTGDGGGIINSGTLTISDSTLELNISDITGGAIANDFGAVLTVIRTTIRGNNSILGGGLVNEGTATLDQCTLENNLASAEGGGISTYEDLFVTNSTISNNHANGHGGGIYNTDRVNVYNSTIAFNEADADGDSGGNGGGIFNSETFNLFNTVVAGNNRSGIPDYEDCFGSLTSFGRNKFSMVPAGCPITQSGPGSATLLASLAELGPLQYNGGPTRTRALVPPSNMIDGAEAIDGCHDRFFNPLATDQRGAARTAGVRCDIGAFEFGSSLPDPVFSSSFEQGEP